MINDDEKERRMAIMRGLVAQCWCDSRTETIEMDVILGEVFAELLYKHYYCPSLGLATTGEMLDEIKTRVDEQE